MPKPKECAHCNKPATIHLTQILDNKIYKVDLCEDCQMKNQFAGDLGLESFSKLAIALSQGGTVESEIDPCPSCGCTQADLQNTGKFGCSTCYEAFEPLLEEIFQNIQSSPQHKGKIPLRGRERMERARKLLSLRKKLEAAIREERYEDAALLRDELREEETSAHQN